MRIWLRILFVVMIISGVVSFTWFLLGSTAYFQRDMDIIGNLYFWGAGIPVLLFCLVFTIILIKGWTPKDGIDYIGIGVGIVLTTLISAALIQSVNTYDWAKEKIYSDTLKTSADGKYEYRIDLINLFQKNSYAQLYLKDISTGEEKYIPTEIQTGRIKTLAYGGINHWVKLEPTEKAFHYILYTTNELRIPEERFEIDLITKIAIKLE